MVAAKLRATTGSTKENQLEQIKCHQSKDLYIFLSLYHFNILIQVMWPRQWRIFGIQHHWDPQAHVTHFFESDVGTHLVQRTTLSLQRLYDIQGYFRKFKQK